MRMAYGSDKYSPISLPHQFLVLAADGERLSISVTSPESEQSVEPEKAELMRAIKALARPDKQALQFVWDTVFWRQCLYVLTVALTCILAAYPLLGGSFMKAVDRLLTLIPLVGSDLDGRWNEWLGRLDDGSRGPIASLLDALSGFMPIYAKPWIDALGMHSVEFTVLIVSILITSVGSSILQERIRDRARLAWHENVAQEYRVWLEESKRGWRNGLLVALGLVGVTLLVVILVGASNATKLYLGIMTAAILALLGLRSLGQRSVSRSESASARSVDKKTIQSTFALAVARYIRTNEIFRRVYGWIFERGVPIGFALLLVAAGLCIINRALFDGVSAAGYFCKGIVGGVSEERIGWKDGFKTDQMCWPSGLVLKAGRRYRVTVITPGDWFDQTIRADVAGFSADDVTHIGATPLKRWWGQDWFKPIARIGEIGNDEYVLDPIDPFDEEKYSLTQCARFNDETIGTGVRAKIKDNVAEDLMKCAPTPEGRKAVVTEIKARRSGELFLYVNDAVLMWPGRSAEFFDNNSGTGIVVVERLTKPLPSSGGIPISN
jgi:hypothetical protein